MDQAKVKVLEDLITPLESLLIITCEEDYEKAQRFILELFAACGDEEGDTLLPLIDILVSAIKKYEEK
jgi:hypothetical protein